MRRRVARDRWEYTLGTSFSGAHSSSLQSAPSCGGAGEDEALQASRNCLLPMPARLLPRTRVACGLLPLGTKMPPLAESMCCAISPSLATTCKLLHTRDRMRLWITRGPSASAGLASCPSTLAHRLLQGAKAFLRQSTVTDRGFRLKDGCAQLENCSHTYLQKGIVNSFFLLNSNKGTPPKAPVTLVSPLTRKKLKQKEEKNVIQRQIKVSVCNRLLEVCLPIF
jgi:hypothetical protein